MSDYVNKRIEYINNWPDVEPFEAEKNYEKRCNDFIEKYGRQPFSLMKLWTDIDDQYNRTISHFIDSIDVMPHHPNFAFTFAFSALDYYSKRQYPNPNPRGKPNITISLKLLAEDITNLSTLNVDVRDTLTALFSVVPVSATAYLYKCLHSGVNPSNNAHSRVTTDVNNRIITDKRDIIDAIFRQYRYDPSRFNDSIRQSALLYRKIFLNNSIVVNGTTFNITDNLRLHLLVSGIVYSLRNDSLHGSSMSSTKSSKTTPKRYALNYYCYLATYTLLMILLVNKSTMSGTDKNVKYAELKNITLSNVADFVNLFGNHLQ